VLLKVALLYSRGDGHDELMLFDAGSQKRASSTTNRFPSASLCTPATPSK
jgi:hypothetical protein